MLKDFPDEKGRKLNNCTILHGLLLCLLSAPVLHGQSNPDTTFLLPHITVTATRSATTTETAPVRITILGTDQLNRSGSVGELLEKRSSAFVQRYGPTGLASLSIRGTGNSQTLLLLDGQRIGDPAVGQLDFSLIPTIFLSSIEVMSGPASALYGTDAVGGVVNLSTTVSSTHPVIKLETSLASFGQREVSVFGSVHTGTTTAVFAAENTSLDGDFSYLNTANSPPIAVRRNNADAKRQTVFSSLSYTGGRHEIRASTWYGHANRGLPGHALYETHNERQADRHFRFWANDNISVARGSLRFSASLQRNQLVYQHPGFAISDTSSSTSSTFEAHFTRSFGSLTVAGAGLVAGLGKARHPSLSESARDENLGVFTHLVTKIGKLRVFPAVRLDRFAYQGTDTKTILSPRLGLNLQVTQSYLVHLKASAGRAFRMPTLNDRFWQPGGNISLQPESGWAYDTSIALRKSNQNFHIEAETGAFANRVKDKIVWIPGPTGIWSPENVNTTNGRGLEGSTGIKVRINNRVLLESTANYTFTHITECSNNASESCSRFQRSHPRHDAKMFAGITWGPVTLDLGVRHTSRRFFSTDGSQSLDPVWIADGQIGVKFSTPGAQSVLTAGVDNLFSRRYDSFPGYPMPPRSFDLRLRISLIPPQ